MKKLLLLILAIAMSFTLTACGGNNDENNAAMQVKVDQVDSMTQEIITWYTDNNYLEMDNSAEIQSSIDTMTANIEAVKTAHQKFLDEGGYDDDLFASKSASIDQIIAGLQTSKDALAAFDDSTGAVVDTSVVTEKYNELAELVNAASAAAMENGWENDEAFNSELELSIAILDSISVDITDPSGLDEAYINELILSIDELIPVWQSYLSQVSEPYAAG